MQLSNIASASIAQLKAFCQENELVVKGDRRLRSTWENAVTAFHSTKDAVIEAAVELAQETVDGAVECIKEAFTYDNAANFTFSATAFTGRSLNFTLKAIWNVLLVTIALTCIAIDLWQDRVETKAFLVQVVGQAKSYAIAKVSDRWSIWTEMGEAVIEMRITEPVSEMRDRMARAKSAIVSG